MRRRPSWGERAARAVERARHQQALLGQAAALRTAIAVQAHHTATHAAYVPPPPPDERIAAQLARLTAAQLALHLTDRLLQTDDPDRQPIVDGQPQPSARDLSAQLADALGRWYRAGAGWWEARIVWRPRIRMTPDPSNDRVLVEVVWTPYGPYYYRHWRAEGQQHTQYLGREQPDDFPVEADTAPPAPRPLDQLSPLVREARDLAQCLQDTLRTVPPRSQRAQRLRRTLRRALKRGQRRLDASTP